jgi:hypothetical protein
MARRLTPSDVLLDGGRRESRCGVEAPARRDVVPNGEGGREETRGCVYIPHPWVYFAEVGSKEIRPGADIMREAPN